jgi:hypothetical protein
MPSAVPFIDHAEIRFPFWKSRGVANMWPNNSSHVRNTEDQRRSIKGTREIVIILSILRGDSMELIINVGHTPYTVTLPTQHFPIHQFLSASHHAKPYTEYLRAFQ